MSDAVAVALITAVSSCSVNIFGLWLVNRGVKKSVDGVLSQAKLDAQTIGHGEGVAAQIAKQDAKDAKEKK